MQYFFIVKFFCRFFCGTFYNILFPIFSVKNPAVAATTAVKTPKNGFNITKYPIENRHE